MRHLILGLILSLAFTAQANAQVTSSVSGTCLVVKSSLMKDARSSEVAFLNNNALGKLRVQKTHNAAVIDACEELVDLSAYHGPWASRQALTLLIVINGKVKHRTDHSLMY